MSVLSIQPRAETAVPNESERLYRAWRYAKAQWDLADHDPNDPEGLSDEERGEYCDREHAALIAYFLHPAEAPLDVSRKMRVLKQEQGWQYNEAPQIIEQIAADVHGLASRQR